MTQATNPLTYNGYVTQIATMAVVNVHTVGGVVVGNGDAAFDALIPQMLNYAELRIQRDLDFLQTVAPRPYTLTSGSNFLSIPVEDFVTIQTISTATGLLLPVTKEFLQNVYGSSSGAANPTYFAMFGGDLATLGNTSTSVMLGPWPDANYPVTVTGTVRMPSLYKSASDPLAGTATTFISANLPDLLIQASMIYVAQFQRNFLPTSNDPQMAGSYETQYENLLKGAIVEEARKKAQSAGWSAMSPALVATPLRG